MSWLRNHLRHFTVPGIKAIVDAHRKAGVPIKKPVDRYGGHAWDYDQDSSSAKVSVTAADIGLPIGMRSSKDAVCSEAGYVLAALESFGVVDDLEPNTIKAIKTLDAKLFIGSSRYDLSSAGKGAEVSKEDQIHNIIKKSFSSLRRILESKPGRRLVLTGRDVWLWEVMARKKNVPTIFDPRVSRKVAGASKQFDELVKTWNIDEHTIIFDTGFAGSIYNAICSAATRVKGQPVKGINLMLSTNCKSPNGESQQLYPNHKNARAKALAIEYLPKYQKSGTVKVVGVNQTTEYQIVQYLADLDEFVKAAALTIWFWHHESPKWIDQGGTRCKGPACPGCKCCKLWRKDVKVKAEEPTSVFESSWKKPALKLYPKYTYRGLDCENKTWHVAGYDSFGGAGILEWCYSEIDAKGMLAYMSTFGQFSGLMVQEFKPNKDGNAKTKLNLHVASKKKDIDW